MDPVAETAEGSAGFQLSLQGLHAPVTRPPQIAGASMLFHAGVVGLYAIGCLTMLTHVRGFPLKPHLPTSAGHGVPLLGFTVYSATRGALGGQFCPTYDRRFERRERKFTTTVFTDFISLTGDPHDPLSLS